jgi:hypothetical protein
MTMIIESATPLRLVDKLGLVQAQIAALQTKENTYKDEIAALGAGAYEGEFYRATVSVAYRLTLSIKAARAKLKALGVGGRWFRDHTKTTEVVSVACKARTGHNIRAAFLSALMPPESAGGFLGFTGLALRGRRDASRGLSRKVLAG